MDTIKAFVKKLLDYFAENPAFTFVIVACCVFIAILIVVVCVLRAKANQAKNNEVQSSPFQEPKEEPTVEEVAPPVVTTVTQTEELQPKTAEKEEPVEVVEEPVKDSVEKKEPVEVKKEVTPTAKKKTPSNPQPKREEKKAETVPETPVVQEPTQPQETVEEEGKEEPKEPIKRARGGRYNGKWTIWHLLTKDENLGENNVEETYFFELLASNGEKLLSSEEYTSYNGALKGIETHKTNILKNNFRVGLSKKGEYIFKLLSGKNTLLCTGENYPTKLRCENAIESTKRFSQTAVLDENIHDIIVQIPLDTDEEEPEYDQSVLGKWIISKTVAEDGDEVYYFELFASNGEKLLSSEEYTSYTGAFNGIQTHKNNIEKDNFRIALTKRGDYIYKVLTGNGQLLCLGEHYKTRRRCENAVESVKRFAKSSPILASPNITPKD